MTEERAAFTFNHDANEMMRIYPDGRFFVKGVEVETNEQIRDTLVEFTHLVTGRNSQVSVDRKDLRHILDWLMIGAPHLDVQQEDFMKVYTLRVTGAAILRARELMKRIEVEP